MEQLDTVIAASRMVLARPKYALGALASLLGIPLFFLFIVEATSGFGGFGDFLGNWQELLMMALMLIVTSVIIAMDWYLLDMHKEHRKAAGVGIGAIVANIAAAILALMACPVCTACVVWGAIFFLLVENRPVALTAGLVLLLMALLYTSRRVLDKCERCCAAAKPVPGRR